MRMMGTSRLFIWLSVPWLRVSAFLTHFDMISLAMQQDTHNLV